jgi:hypothetical protein
MTDTDKRARLRAEETGDELAIGKAERRMAYEAREMDRGIKKLEDTEKRAKHQVEEEWRREHGGHEPERLPYWQITEGRELLRHGAIAAKPMSGTVGDAAAVTFGRLPPPIRDYVSRALPRPQPVTDRVTVKQTGEMVLKPGAAPRPFTATEVLATDQVNFTWRARFPVLGPLSLHVTDSYREDEGRLQVRLLGVPLRSKREHALAAGEAFRYLAELPWVPQAIVSNPTLEWHEIDARTVEVSTRVADARIAVNLTFDSTGDIIRASAQRPRLEADGEPTEWIGLYSGYRELGGVRLPTRGEVRWELPAGPFTYWRGAITGFEAHDQPRSGEEVSRPSV